MNKTNSIVIADMVIILLESKNIEPVDISGTEDIIWFRDANTGLDCCLSFASLYTPEDTMPYMASSTMPDFFI